MADRKITDLTALTTPATGDLIPIVDISEAAAADKNKKITVGELLRGAPDGTAAAPGFAFESDGGNGMFLGGTDILAFSTAGSQRITVDASGRVLVGTSSVTSTLPKFVVEGRGGAGAQPAQVHLRRSEAASNITADESIGFLVFCDNADKQFAYIGCAADENAGTDDYPGRLIFATTADGEDAPTERMRIDSSGKLLVGTTTAPSAVGPLQIVDTVSSILVLARNDTSISEGNNVGEIRFLSNDSTAASYEQCATIAASADGTFADGDKPTRLVFSTTADGASSPTERLRIDSAGNVGIGTGAPAEILALRSSSSAIQIDTNRSNTTYGNAEILLGSPRSDTADGSTVIGRGLLSCLGNSTSTTGIVWLQAATASLVTQLTDADLKTKQCGIRLASDGSFEHWSSGSQRLKIDAAGRLLVGTSSAKAFNGLVPRLQVEGTDNSNARMSLFRVSDDNGGPAFTFAKARNTSHKVLQQDDYLGQIDWYGSDGIDTNNLGARISARVDGTAGSNDLPTRLEFSTTADGASVPTERMRIESNGKVELFGSIYGQERTIGTSSFNLNTGNFWTCGAIAIPNPTNGVAGMSGLIRVTAAPTSFGSNWDFPGGSYTAPTTFPAVAPFYVVNSTTFYLGNWTEGIA